jgi:lambda repressor-like predicted transcriptional regulator
MAKTEAVRDALLAAVRLKGWTITGLAAELDENRSTVNSWLHSRKYDPARGQDRKIVERVCAVIGVPPDQIWTTQEVPAMPPPVDHNILEILLDLLEDPNAPKEKKRAARSTIMNWLKNLRK